MGTATRTAPKVKPAALQYNRFNVPQKMWLKWSVQARHVFNRMYEYLISIEASPDVVLHPNSAKPNAEEWQTLAWNMSFMAAQAVDNRL
jgi:hypothetical protein